MDSLVNFGSLLLFKRRLILSFPVWVFHFGSKLKLETISSVGDSVKPKKSVSFKSAQVLEVFQSPWCGRHPPQARVPRL